MHIRAERSEQQVAAHSIKPDSDSLSCRDQFTSIDQKLSFNTDAAGFYHNLLLSATTSDYIRGHPILVGVLTLWFTTTKNT